MTCQSLPLEQGCERLDRGHAINGRAGLLHEAPGIGDEVCDPLRSDACVHATYSFPSDEPRSGARRMRQNSERKGAVMCSSTSPSDFDHCYAASSSAHASPQRAWNKWR